MYKRVAGVESESQLEDVAGELGDRYGAPPPPVRNLLEYATLKLLSQRIGVAQIERRRDAVSIRFTEKATVDPERLARFVAGEAGQPVHSRRRAEIFAERKAAGTDSGAAEVVARTTGGRAADGGLTATS